MNKIFKKEESSLRLGKNSDPEISEQVLRTLSTWYYTSWTKLLNEEWFKVIL